jgi:hypothetical protein
MENVALMKETATIVEISAFTVSPLKLKMATDEALRVMILNNVFYPREIAEMIAFAVLKIVHNIKEA